MDPNYAAFGSDQPAFDSQAFNGFANLDFGGPFNTANGFTYCENPGLMSSFDEYFANMPLNGLDQSGSDLVPMGAAFNSGQPNFTALPTQSPVNVLNQHFTNTPVNGTAQFGDTTSSNGSGQPSLSTLNSFDKPNATTPLNHSANPESNNLFSQTTPLNGSGQPTLSASTSFDKPGSTTPVNGTHQFSDNASSNGPGTTTPSNSTRSAQPVSKNFPLHAPHRQVPYDPSIAIPYTPEDTDADKVRKWENLIAHANLANAGVPPSASRIIEKEAGGQSPKTVDSPNSLFDCPRSPSVEIIETPSTTPPTSSPPQAPATTKAPPRAATNVTAPSTPRTVQLPRALTSEKGYAQHVSPFAPVTVLPPGPSASTSRELEKAKSRIQSLVKERDYYQRSLRKATSVDAKSGKTSLQLLQTQNTALRRTNAKQARENEELRQKLQAATQSYATLVDQYNRNIQQLHKAQIELKQLGK
ncbi:hypothetical protein N7491_006345 [Penicillium cf. griseofulvum]|uniref:Uncharacterized protein n=1 Tax=Penicillium cf. griseofulvum TaxID=2972120 RepID=A0A9W9M232_9EURO|nr:hypothetical protein N7472_010624 [Penicillium cf. griseofulvum]KAJ5429329.1 hypothetical protein N7491_006345 [Penicillium cf. griseofulvum]KAJ5436893.1 hypothetical protein N7445_007778 [Penicillium cf. griseofulvum]